MNDYRAEALAAVEQEQQQREAATAEETPPLRALDLSAAMDTDDSPTPWLARGRFTRGEVVLLASEGKLGKSLAALDLAFAAATGQPWLGAIEIEGGPYRVLYVDEEQPEATIRRRVSQLARGRGLDREVLATVPLRYVWKNRLNLDDQTRHAALMREVQCWQPGLIILDALVRFHDRDENANGAMAAFFRDAILPLGVGGATIVILHHVSKPSKDRPGNGLLHRVRGASDLVNVADEILTLARERHGEDDAARVLRHEAGRLDELAEPLVVHREALEDGGVRLRATTTERETRAEVLEVLREAGEDGVLREDIVSSLANGESDDAAARSATRALGALFAERLVAKRRDGRPVRYWVAECAPADAERATMGPD